MINRNKVKTFLFKDIIITSILIEFPRFLKSTNRFTLLSNIFKHFIKSSIYSYKIAKFRFLLNKS